VGCDSTAFSFLSSFAASRRKETNITEKNIIKGIPHGLDIGSFYIIV
jgi:hypothetical protein